jgi:hemin uptake protein HemP
MLMRINCNSNCISISESWLFIQCESFALRCLHVLSHAPLLSTPVPDQTHATSGPTGCPRWDSRTLLGQAEQAEIHHGDQVYRLRLTALGKLILTK